ncbi:MAG: hypothetical protein ABSG68_16070 [Thermoguttaceae bacterium]
MSIDQPDFDTPAVGPLRWRVWPARQQPLATVAVLLGLAATAAVVAALAGSTALACCAAAALAVAMWRFFLPVTFELNALGVDQNILGRRRRTAWGAIGYYELCRGGLLLLEHDEVCPMAVYGSLYLPWLGHREEVLALVRRYLGEAVQAPER